MRIDTKKAKAAWLLSRLQHVRQQQVLGCSNARSWLKRVHEVPPIRFFTPEEAAAH